MNLVMLQYLLSATLFPATWSPELIYALLIGLSSLLLVVLLVLVINFRRHRSHDRETMRMLEEKNDEIARLKDSFIANMTHEIRTPLNAIIGFAEMLCDMEMDAESKATCKVEINENKRHLLQLVNDLLDYSRIESGTLDYNDEEVDILSAIREICQRENAHTHAPGVEANLVESLPSCRLRVDKMRFTQVLGNLIRNALKFTQQGSVNVGVRRLDNGSFYFYVADTGCGIDEEGRKAIFDRFVKMNKNIKGTGLGLSISKAIVEHYGGGIGVESKKGEGSTFYFTLPGKLLFQEHGRF